MSRASSVPHRKRAEFSNSSAHVTLHLCPGLSGLRSRCIYRVIESAIRGGKEREGFRVTHFCVLSNHFHFVVEADCKNDLARGMQGLAIRLAKAYNRVVGRKGKVFAERYFVRILESFYKLRTAVRYVLMNARRHGIRLPKGELDPFSSARWHPWHGREEEWRRIGPEAPVARPRSQYGELVALQGHGVDDLPYAALASP